MLLIETNEGLSIVFIVAKITLPESAYQTT
jgi:hypothetical protein